MNWEPEARQAWCGPCGALRAPDGCVHRIAGLKASRSAPTYDRGRSRRGVGEVIGDLAESLFDHTLGAIGRGIAAVFRALID